MRKLVLVTNLLFVSPLLAIQQDGMETEVARTRAYFGETGGQAVSPTPLLRPALLVSRRIASSGQVVSNERGSHPVFRVSRRNAAVQDAIKNIMHDTAENLRRDATTNTIGSAVSLLVGIGAGLTALLASGPLWAQVILGTLGLTGLISATLLGLFAYRDYATANTIDAAYGYIHDW